MSQTTTTDSKCPRSVRNGFAWKGCRRRSCESTSPRKGSTAISLVQAWAFEQYLWGGHGRSSWLKRRCET